MVSPPRSRSARRVYLPWWSRRTTLRGWRARSSSPLPGLLHDVCSTVHPLGLASPFFRTLHLERYGVGWVFSGPARPPARRSSAGARAIVRGNRAPPGPGRRGLSSPDRAVGSGLRRAPARDLGSAALAELCRSCSRNSAWSRSGPCRASRRRVSPGGRPRRSSAGMAAHSMLALTAPGGASFGLVLAAAGHAVGWPVIEGGSQRLTDALVRCLRELGGELEVSRPITDFSELPVGASVPVRRDPATTPRHRRGAATRTLPSPPQAVSLRPGVFKLDLASERAHSLDEAATRAATLHLSGDLATLTRSKPPL